MSSEDSSFWIGSGSFSDPLIESSQAIMQTEERRKRQNCGNSFYGRHQRVSGGTGQIGLGSNLTVAAEGNVTHCYGPMFSVQGGMTQGSNEGVSVNHPAGYSRDNFHPYMNDESRNSYKRKSSMDSSAGALASRNVSGRRESDFVRFTPVSGTRRLETPMNHAYGELQSTWDSRNTFQSSRTNAMPQERANRYDGINAFWTRENYCYPPIIGGVPSQPLMPRTMPTTSIGSAGNMSIGLPEVLSFRQDNGFGTWCANNTSGEEVNNYSGFGNEGSQPRNSLMEVIDISEIDSRLPQPQNRTSRSVRSREVNSQAFHTSHHYPFVYGGTAEIQPPVTSVAQPSSRFNNVHSHGAMLRFPPPGSAAALNNLMSGSEATYGDAYPSFAIRPGQTPLTRYNDINRGSYVHHIRGQRAAPLEGMNRHRFAASHELFNQSLIYNGGDWADFHDQHSDMRLDVDNMSYEELLALEERIGNVSTGLSEDNVDECLKTSKYSTSGGNSEESDLKCSVCQEEYMEGDELGHLDCGHGYHTACIKQWLALKNQCPICKAGAGSKA